MCMASVSDCRALAEGHPVEVTRARMPWFISSQAEEREEREMARDEIAPPQ